MDRILCVGDWNGLSWDLLKLLRLYVNDYGIYTALLYPECLSSLCLINVPSWLRWPTRLTLKFMVLPIKILNKPSDLLEWIDAEELPKTNPSYRLSPLYFRLAASIFSFPPVLLRQFLGVYPLRFIGVDRRRGVAETIRWEERLVLM